MGEKQIPSDMVGTFGHSAPFVPPLGAPFISPFGSPFEAQGK